jgi:hypothetical protein
MKNAIEKYGAYWIEEIGSGFQLIHERYDKNSDLLAAVFFKSPDTFRVACFEKLTGTPQWAGLWWTERRPDSIFSEEVEAVAFAEKLLAEK